MNVREKIREWINLNSCEEFINDIDFYHDIKIDNIIDFFFEAKLENLFYEKNINDITTKIVMFSEPKLVLDTGNEIRNFWFRFVDEKSGQILFEKDIGVNRRKI